MFDIFHKKRYCYVMYISLVQARLINYLMCTSTFLFYGGMNHIYFLSVYPICVGYSKCQVYQGQHLTQTARSPMVGLRCMTSRDGYTFPVLGVESNILAQLDLIDALSTKRPSHL